MWTDATADNVSVPISARSDALSAAQRAAVAGLIRPPPSARYGGKPWGRPSFAVSDRWRAAARAAWANSSSSGSEAGNEAQGDDSAYIQGIIDSTPNSTALLPAGTYHIRTPLKLGGSHFLLGAGPERTFIFALDPEMAMVGGDGSGGSYSLHIAGLTLSGGAYGIHMSEGTFGVHAQVTESWISHCLFANMSKAAIFVDDI